MLNNVIWMDVLGFEGRYQANNLGEIKSVLENRKPKVLKQRDWKGYKKIVLWKDGERHFYQVHRIIWEAFNGPIPEGLEIDHIDGNQSNNCLENLRAVSHLTNLLNPITVSRRKVLTDEERKKRGRECSKRYYQKNKEMCNQKKKKQRMEKKAAEHEKMLQDLGMTEEEYQRNKEEERKERVRAYNKEYYESNKKKCYEASKRWENAHKEEVREYHRAYWEQNKDKYRVKASYIS